MIIRVRSRDGMERVTIHNPQPTLAHLKSIIQTQLRLPVHAQTLSMNHNILLAKSPESLALFSDMSNPSTPLASVNIAHGSIVYLAYQGERTIPGPATCRSLVPAFRKMTMDDLIAKQMRVTPQEKPHCELVSFDRHAANHFQKYVNESLAFAMKRGGFLYGTVSQSGKVEVDFIYEPPQQGTPENLMLQRDPNEEKLVEAIAFGLGMRKVGFIFTQTVNQDARDYMMSSTEILQAVELHTKGGLKEWVTAVVKLGFNEEGNTDVHFEAFQLSNMCARLFKEGWFERQAGTGKVDPKFSRMTKDVVVGGKDTRDVHNDFFLVPVKILDHQGPLSSNFPVENRTDPATLNALKSHLDRTENLPLVKRISDFHLLLFISRFMDINADVPTLAACVVTQDSVPEGYQLLIESLAGIV